MIVFIYVANKDFPDVLVLLLHWLILLGFQYLPADAKKGPLSQFLSKLSAKLTGRPLETPESPSTSSSFISSKLILKVALVAGIAVVWKFYLE